MGNWKGQLANKDESVEKKQKAIMLEETCELKVNRVIEEKADGWECQFCCQFEGL